MNNNNGALDFDAYIADTDFKKSIDEMKARIMGLSKTAEDEGNKIDEVFKKLGAGLAGYFSVSAMANFGKQIVQVRGDFQQLEVAFNTMLGSKAKADELMSQIVQTAATTPFDLQGVANGAKQLLAYGESSENVNETLVRLGNIASGLSLPLNDLVYLYGTTMVQGRLFTQDVRQFMGRGIPLVQELSKELGKTTDEINQMVTDGKIGFPEVQKVIERLTDEGGMFYNLMEAQSKTLTGQISNLEDAWSSMLNEIGKRSQDTISAGIEAAANLVEHYDEILKILKVLIITYGGYKAAVITLNAVQAVQIELAKGYTLAELAKYRALLLAEGAQKLLNKTMLANPYILAATALIGLVTALVTFGSKASEAEEYQNRLNEATKRANDSTSEEIAKIESLVAVIKSETTAQGAKKKALQDLIALSPDHLAGITEETIRTGEAQVAIDNYVESLRKKILMEELEKELAESIKREEAAKNGENQVGWFTRLGLHQMAANQNQYAGFTGQEITSGTELIQQANAELNASIIAKEKAFQDEIKQKIEDIYSGSETSAGDNDTTSGIKTVGDRIKEIDDQVSNLEADRKKLAATDAAGIAKINAEISKLEKEKKTLEGKGSTSNKYADAEKGSLNYYKQLKEQSVKALENLNAADSEYATKQTALLSKIAEADKKILEIENGSKSFAEQLEAKKKAYETYEKWVAAGLQSEARQEFSALLSEGDTFVAYIDKQIAELKSKTNLTSDEAKNLVSLTEARDEATGKKSPIESFKENLESAKSEAKTLVEYLEKVRSLEKDLESDNSELGLAKKGILAEEDTDTTKAIAEETKRYIQEYESYNQKKLRLDADYQNKKALLEKANTEGQYNDQLAELEKWYKTALSTLGAEVEQKSDLWTRLFANTANLAKSTIRRTIQDTKDFLNYLNGATTDRPIGFTDEQLDAIKNDPEKIKAIYDALIKQQDELDSRSDYQFAGIVKGFGDLKEASELAKKAQKEQNDEIRKNLQLQAEMAQQKGMKEILSGITDFGNVISAFAGAIQQLADATGDDGLKDTAEALNGVGNIVSSTAMGAATGGWIGAIVGAVTSIGSELFNSFAQAEASATQAKKDALNWARQYQLLMLELEATDYESAFGTRAISMATEAYELMVKALEAYNAAVSSTSDMQKTTDLLNLTFGTNCSKEDLYKYASDLENMAIKTKDYGWFAELFGADDEYTKLRDLAPEIWADGTFNVEAARTFLEANNQISDSQREQIQHVIDLHDQYEELDKTVTEDISDTWGDLGKTLVDSISESIRTGEDKMEIFADKVGEKFEGLGEKIAYELFFADYFDDLLASLKSTYGLDSPDAIGKAQADLIGNFFTSMGAEADKAQEWLEQWKEYAARYGFDIWQGEEETTEDPLTGAVQKMTSEEASAIAGQMTMIRIKQDAMTDYLGQQLAQLVGIRENTARTVDRLDQILDRLGSDNVTNSMRSKGL